MPFGVVGLQLLTYLLGQHSQGLCRIMRATIQHNYSSICPVDCAGRIPGHLLVNLDCKSSMAFSSPIFSCFFLVTFFGKLSEALQGTVVLILFVSFCLLEDYLSDLQGRADGDPRTAWDFYSSTVLGRQSSNSSD